MSFYDHVPHSHLAARRRQGPVKVADQLPQDGRYARLNRWLALKVTAAVGSMTCAYLFFALALVSLPAAIKSGSVIVIVSWIAQTCLQLVLLAVILVGQAVQAQATDKRAEQEFRDVEIILHGQGQQAQHLAAQDEQILAILGQLDLSTDGGLKDVLTAVRDVRELVLAQALRSPARGKPAR